MTSIKRSRRDRRRKSRRSKSPLRHYSKTESIDDFETLKSYLRTTPPKLPFKRSHAGYSASNRFFQQKRLSTPGSDKTASCLSKWRSKSPELIRKWKSHQRRYKSKKDLFGFLVYLNKAPAQFPPSIAGMIYKTFEATHVFDPFAGWGDRCIAAMAMGIDYTGVDSNVSLKSSYKKMIEFYWENAESDHSESKLRYENSGQVVEIHFKPCQNVPMKNIEYDLVFSSPPFWKNGKLVEKYPKCDNDYENFMETCMIPMMKKFKSKQVWTCLHIPENMYTDLENIFGKCRKIINFRTGKWGKESESPNNLVYCWKWAQE